MAAKFVAKWFLANLWKVFLLEWSQIRCFIFGHLPVIFREVFLLEWSQIDLFSGDCLTYFGESTSNKQSHFQLLVLLAICPEGYQNNRKAMENSPEYTVSRKKLSIGRKYENGFEPLFCEIYFISKPHSPKPSFKKLKN